MNDVAARAWAHRAVVERASAVQFERLASLLSALEAPPLLVDLARTAISDERRHELLCTALARSAGCEPVFPAEVPHLAPTHFDDVARCAWLAVAHCCIAETESVATLTLLVPRPPDAARDAVVQETLVEIARDEVKHAQLGWAVVTWLSGRRPLGFLAKGLPAMLETGARPLYAAGDEVSAGGLERDGVLPRAKARAVFEETLFGVVLPGLAEVGIDGASAREWIATARGAGVSGAS